MSDRRPLGTTREVAEYFNITEQTIYDQRHRGVEPGSLGIRVGRHLRFDWSAIDRWVEKRAGERDVQAAA